MDAAPDEAALHAAYDEETAVWYLYREYYRGEAEPSVHAKGIRGAGAWIRGVIDPAARGRSQVDGRVLLEMYRDLGLKLHVASNAVQTGLDAVYDALSSGGIKIFRTLSNLRAELRLYHRDEKGRVVKERDHLVDCLRYLMLSGRDQARALTPKTEEEPGGLWSTGELGRGGRQYGWMG